MEAIRMGWGYLVAFYSALVSRVQYLIRRRTAYRLRWSIHNGLRGMGRPEFLGPISGMGRDGDIQEVSVKRDALDAIFSDCIRLAANCCEAHGEPMLYGNTACSQHLECAHIHSRRHQYLRHNPLNALSLCGAHHRWYTDHPTVFTDFIDRQYPGRLEILLPMLQVKHKWLKGMKAEARAHYRKEYQSLLDRRSAGETGQLDFIGFL